MDFITHHPFECIVVAFILVLVLKAFASNSSAVREVLEPEEQDVGRVANLLRATRAEIDVSRSPAEVVEICVERIARGAPDPLPSATAAVCAALRSETPPPLNSYVLPREGANANARFLTGIFVFVGLFGTVGDIALSVAKLSSVIAASNATADSTHLEKVATNIGDLLGNMGGAFVCTLFGIGSTLLLSFFNASYARREEALTQAVNDLIQQEVAPLIRARQAEPFDEDDEELVSQESRRYSSAEVTLLLRNSVEQLAKALPDISAGVRYLDASAATLARAVPEAVNQMQVVVTQAGAVGDGLVAAATQLKTQTEHSIDLIEKTSAVSQKTTVVAGQVLSKIDAYLSTLSATGERFQSITDNLKTASQTLSDAQTGVREDIRQAVTDMHKAVRELKEDLAADRQIQTQSLSDLGNRIAATDQRLAQILAHFELTLTEMTAIAGSADLNREMASFIAQLQGLNQGIGKTREAVIGAAGVIEQEAKRARDRDDRAQRSEQSLQTVIQKMSQIDRQMDNLSQKAQTVAETNQALREESLEHRIAEGWKKLTRK